ncbi:MAG: hypothetical protein IKQ61_04340 [Spirochaetales bacterium]|nr:hypothetical protein [Spirochaetales bacterium]
MSDFINDDIIDFDNDASASSFGWNFQANAGIFLFLHYIREAENFKIESKLQDIEITLKNKNKILAQAKSSQDPSTDKGKKTKFKDALISIAKSSKKEPQAHFIYISNESDTFASGDKAFDNRIRSYNECLQSIKKEIDETIDATIKSLSAKIENSDKSSNDKKTKKLTEIKRLIENLNKDNLYISCITQFWGEEENRYDSIKEKINDFLLNVLNYDSITVKKISNRLFEHWSFKCEFNSTQKDESKEMSKESFLWPISVFLLNDIHRDITDCLSFICDSSLTEEVDAIFEDNKMLYHERFEFSNKILQDYYDFKRTLTLGTKEPEKEFIKKNWENYVAEFNQENFGTEKLEYITKSFIYRILMNSKNLQNICSQVGINR